MHFFNAITSCAVLSTASAAVIPRILTDFEPQGGMGTLPQIIPTAATILTDLTAMDKAITNLTDVLQSPSGGIIKAISDISSIISHTISIQSANRQAMLDVQELDTVFSASDSSSIINKLKDDVYPHAKTALDYLGQAKSEGLLNTLASRFAVLPYLNVLSSEYDGFSSGLLKYIDSGSQADAKSVLDNIKNLLASTISTYSG
ncbi:hypothetical protein CGCSCA4_v001639 [Colletotrichum siamense]|uniref:Antigenic cell wall n=1 Tax=Colletotrichum siamense TaxID=690259 RepID=A0A9P5F2S3_COLSI|nr:hypothetical protein CGCSCA4_v001639 [Colletotrichum siamense]KAF4864770.1 hypothetical protein CGCSCA2_v001775 [Colletotrichum siamense]KAJ3942604.1 hypothetical protein N0V92_013765 [Colletotrichum tropicale]